jgi:protease IV
MKRAVQIFFIILAIFFAASLFMGIGGMIAVFDPPEERVGKASILALDLDGVITDGKEFLDLLRKYRKEDRIKGVLIRINSPGGVVGPSQEIYAEIKRTREEFKKPVIAFCGAVAASGAFYAAVAADKIVTNPGCMIGSIGVLMEFVNLEHLYEWAKIQRYALTTGKFKDAGAEYKALTTEQRALFQDLIDDVLLQFKQAIVEGRRLKMDFVSQYSDGRVFTGSQAIKLGFADQIGTWDDARKMLGEMTGLGENPEVFKAKKRRGVMDIFDDATAESKISKFVRGAMASELNARPLFLMPGAVTF